MVKEKKVLGDVTTRYRFALHFNEDSDIRDAYHTICDYSLRVTKALHKQIEEDVQEWLDNNGIESTHLELSLLSGKKDERPKSLTFWRIETMVKTCANNWDVLHLAHASFWPRLISSKPKLTIQHSGDYLTMRNELRTVNYGHYEERECVFAARLLKEEKSTVVIKAGRKGR